MIRIMTHFGKQKCFVFKRYCEFYVKEEAVNLVFTE
jgi:hypothetical protein